MKKLLILQLIVFIFFFIFMFSPKETYDDAPYPERASPACPPGQTFDQAQEECVLIERM